MKRNIYITVLCIACFFCFSACSPLTERGFHFDEKTFTSEWNAWKDGNIQNYSFTLSGELPHWNFERAILMYDYTVNIIVKNGVMESFEYTGNVPYEEDWETIMEPEFTSISDMYQKISDRAEKQKEWWEENTGGGTISTRYELGFDNQFHYIKFFEPVSTWDPDLIVDTTLHAVIVSNFKALD